MSRVVYCNEADCEGIGVCPCRDWRNLDEAAEKAYWDFDALRKGDPPFDGKRESGDERLAFKAIYNRRM